MSKRLWMVAVVALALFGAATAGPGPVLAQEHRVGIDDSSQDAQQWHFEPDELTVPAGSTVVWQNTGQYAHTVTAEDQSFDSGSLAPGAEFRHTFGSGGELRYACEPHPWKRGLIRVEGGSGGGAPAGETTTTAPPTTTAPASPIPALPVPLPLQTG